MSTTTELQSPDAVRDALGNYRERISCYLGSGLDPAKRKEAERSLSYACDLLAEALEAAGYATDDVSYVKCGDDRWVIDWRPSTHKNRRSVLPAGLPLVDHIDDLIAL